MKEYIEREAAINTINKLRICLRERGAYDYDLGAAEAKLRVEEIPAADVVPVVFCRDCKLHDNCYTEDVFKFARLNNDKRFCGVGERKGGDE